MIKKFARSLWMVALAALAFACSEDDPLPRATVDFTNETAEVGRPVMFDNLTLNADHYEWTFGNGETSTDISPTVTFNDPGPVNVVLKAFTKDGQVDSVSREITIRQRFLVAYSVKSFPQDSLGFPWDKDAATEEDKRPDLLVDFIVNKSNADLTEEDINNSLLGPIFFNAKGQDVSNTVTFDLILTDEPWAFVLRDWDGADENKITLDDPFSLVMGATFNPVQAPSIRNEDGTGGNFSITGFNSSDQFIDITFFYELR
ncbi:MAG: PKD domain-containing protein [Cyclobacteriaceae bacterium]|nr:PKD domain-containing protein [Flammeovirgaceae bacterium]MCW5903230.1 PKD domain-containing protein [Cyclobacteriaceae bacterium]